MSLVAFITGQDGSYLAELLLEKNFIVHHMIRLQSTINTKKINHILYKIKSEQSKMTCLEIYNLGA